MCLFPPVSILFLLVACGGDVETGLHAPFVGGEAVSFTSFNSKPKGDKGEINLMLVP